MAARRRHPPGNEGADAGSCRIASRVADFHIAQENFMPSIQQLISQAARHGLTGLGIVLIATAGLVAQVQAQAAITGGPSVTVQAGEAVATTVASVRGAFQGGPEHP
jgi:hypothetical protein